MANENQILVVDAGNTSIKLGVFENDDLQRVERFSIEQLSELRAWLDAQSPSSIALSSVLSEEDTQLLVDKLGKITRIDASSLLPIKLNYDTPETLGIDRICNAAYLAKHAASTFAVSIDVGTCIKFDLVSKSDGYLGGSIAPGIDLRYKSLNDYTGKLPLLSNKSKGALVGTSTSASIHSGVINGLEAEIQGMMQGYQERYGDLTFFVTGGDANSFDLRSKNDIFADENLTLKGLYEIYKHNA